jgi:hypothetical protein
VWCFLCGTDWIIKYYLDELRLQRVDSFEYVTFQHRDWLICCPFSAFTLYSTLFKDRTKGNRDKMYFGTPNGSFHTLTSNPNPTLPLYPRHFYVMFHPIVRAGSFAKGANNELYWFIDCHDVRPLFCAHTKAGVERFRLWLQPYACLLPFIGVFSFMNFVQNFSCVCASGLTSLRISSHTLCSKQGALQFEEHAWCLGYILHIQIGCNQR